MTERVLRNIFITGADKGLGAALVAHFLRDGYQVLAGVHASSTELLSSLASDAQQVHLIPLDVTLPESIAHAVHQTLEITSALDILVNNAGVHLEKEAASLEELNFGDGHLERTMAVNAFGPLRVVQQFLPLLENGHGKLIVNISSEAGSIADCWRSREFAYCMSKAALNMQSKLLRNYLAPRGYQVLAVHPGWMRTDMGGQSADISPDQAAAGIFDLVRQGHQPSDEIYLDYQAKPLRW
jgi:NAD(P)-dependent dehydrogenase (short-subunit alcohol dehydrogenase family)